MPTFNWTRTPRPDEKLSRKFSKQTDNKHYGGKARLLEKSHQMLQVLGGLGCLGKTRVLTLRPHNLHKHHSRHEAAQQANCLCKVAPLALKFQGVIASLPRLNKR